MKIGSAVLAPGGRLDDAVLTRLARQIGSLYARDVRTTVVSSGAVASGFRSLGLEAPPRTIVAKQAAAALGQHRLMAAWADALQHAGLHAAQILYTADDLDDRPRFLSARRTLHELLAARCVPIVNENDSISFDEIRLGDNDRLSALTANLVDADLLLILSSVPGLLRRDKPSAIIPIVRDTDEAMSHVRPEKSATGVGGMVTKIQAAAIAAGWGIPTIIAAGSEPDVILRAASGEAVGTRFEPRPRRTPSRKRWLASSARTRGAITIDEGAARALRQRGASLLPSGIVSVSGDFARHEPVEIKAGGTPLARGLACYGSAEIARIKGIRSSRIAAVLGYCYSDEVVHRNDLVLLDAPRAATEPSP